MKRLVLYILMLVAGFPLFGQETTVPTDAEARLAVLFDSLKNCQTDSLKHDISRRIERTLKTELEEPASFYKSFASLPFLGKVTSSDNKVRVYTWSYPLSDKTYGYGGFVQRLPKRKDRKADVVQLKVKSKAFVPANSKRVNVNDWYGALYYKVIPVKRRRDVYYVLLGWGGNNVASSFKVIDVLTFNGKSAYLGKLVLKTKRKTLQRFVLEHSAEAKVALSYEKELNMIVFDHLVPTEPVFTGVYSHYGPDFTYDAFELDGNVWVFVENIDVKNKE
ncbi:MAG: hypothetical protein J6R41_11375 [Paludibacteraceae bacterium]|nr:hypothetical protein [Paludibacteraceae bacterium]